MNVITHTLAATALTLCAPMAMANSWTLEGEGSNLSFGSIKSGTTGETHSFQTFSGTVSDSGAVEITIDLSSVETNIDIRNERMIEHVFKAAKTATITTQIDMAGLNALAVGQSQILEVEGTVSLRGTDVALDAEMFVMRISEDTAMVSTNGMVFLDLEDAGLSAGIDVLMDLAGLDSITRTSPVTMRLMFTQDDDEV